MVGISISLVLCAAFRGDHMASAVEDRFTFNFTRCGLIHGRVRRRRAVTACVSPTAALALKAETMSIPIVFIIGEPLRPAWSRASTAQAETSQG